MWSRRAQEYDAKIHSGDPLKIAEVVRDLFRKNNQPEQSYSERQLFEKAYDRILCEFEIILNSSKEATQKKLDKALKRNLENQPKTPTSPTKTTTSRDGSAIFAPQPPAIS